MGQPIPGYDVVILLLAFLWLILLTLTFAASSGISAMPRRSSAHAQCGLSSATETACAPCCVRHTSTTSSGELGLGGPHEVR